MINKEFPTGAIRENVEVPRYSLIPPSCLRRLALVYSEGAKRYGDYNWTKGLPYTNTLDHALEHLAMYLSSDRSVDHLAKVAWAMFTLMYFDDNPQIIEPDIKWVGWLLSSISDIGIDSPTVTCFICGKDIMTDRPYITQYANDIFYSWHIKCREVTDICWTCKKALTQDTVYKHLSDGTSICKECSDKLNRVSIDIFEEGISHTISSSTKCHKCGNFTSGPMYLTVGNHKICQNCNDEVDRSAGV